MDSMEWWATSEPDEPATNTSATRDRRAAPRLARLAENHDAERETDQSDPRA
jgi:hypothetical protein